VFLLGVIQKGLLYNAVEGIANHPAPQQHGIMVLLFRGLVNDIMNYRCIARLTADPSVRRAGAGLIAGLYLGRVYLEQVPPSRDFAGFALVAVLGMAAGYLFASLAKAAWPALWLLGYLLYPTIDPRVAGIVAVLALASWLTCLRLPPGLGWDVAVMLAALVVYVSTAAPGLLPADEGEFQLVVSELGIAHPPGYSLYTVAGWAFTQAMPGDFAYRVNLFSAFTAALALGVLCRAIRRETHSGPAGAVAALTLGAATSFWMTATQASIRPMTALFAALLLDALLAYRRATLREQRPRADYALIRFALCLGLGVTHHASIVFVAAVFALALLAVDPDLLRRPRRWVQPGVALLAGFIPWLYLPIRPLYIDTTELGADLTTWRGFWQHVSARGFSGDLFYFDAPGELLDRLRTLADVVVFQWDGLVLLLAGLAALAMLWRTRWMLFALGGAFALHTVIAASYRAPQTVEYMVPAYVCLAAGIGWLVGEARRVAARQNVGYVLFAAAVLAGALTFAANRPGMAYRHETGSDTHAAAERLLDDTPEGGVLLANWHWITPLRYLQRVEEIRPDVELVYVYPDGAEPLDETWARRVREYVEVGRPVAVSSFYREAYAATGYTFEPQVSGPGWLVRGEPRRTLPREIEPLDAPVSFDGGLSLAGEPVIVSGGDYDPVTVALAWRVETPPGRDVTSFLHAVDDQGRVLRQDDVPLSTSGATEGEIILARYTLERFAGAVELVAGLYATGEAGIELLPAADGSERVTVASVDAPAPLPLSPVTEHCRYDVFEDGLVLTGYDYDTSLPGRARLYLHWLYRGSGWADFDLTLSHRDTAFATGRFRAQPGERFTTAYDIPPDAEGVYIALEEAGCGCLSRVVGPFGLASGYGVTLPAPAPGDRYVPLGSGIMLTGISVDAPEALAPGDTVEATLRFRAAYPLTADDVVKVDLIGLDGDLWAWREQSDHIPADGATPTLKWTWGSVVIDRHTLTVPDAAKPGQPARLELALYDHFTGRALPILDPALAALGQTLHIWGQGALQ
jgi:hypothetical protein